MLRVTEPRPPVVVVGRITSARTADASPDGPGADVLGRSVIMDGMPGDEPARDRILTAAAVEELGVIRAGSRE